MTESGRAVLDQVRAALDPPRLPTDPPLFHPDQSLCITENSATLMEEDLLRMHPLLVWCLYPAHVDAWSAHWSGGELRYAVPGDDAIDVMPNAGCFSNEADDQGWARLPVGAQFRIVWTAPSAMTERAYVPAVCYVLIYNS